MRKVLSIICIVGFVCHGMVACNNESVGVAENEMVEPTAVDEESVVEETQIQTDYEEVFTLYTNAVISIANSNTSGNMIRVSNMTAMGEIRAFLDIVNNDELKRIHVETFYRLSNDADLKQQINWLNYGY